ncbi:MAG: hypothetical protein HFF51_01490 [Lawsonibacter sp.]|nr:hypothetical protein [Lawsonibacter sp.]
MPGKSRAQYFRERRKDRKSFVVEVEREKMERFEEKLKEKNISKVKWLNEKIDEELGE